MNMHDMIENGGRPPKKGSWVRVNRSARSSKHRNATGKVQSYHIVVRFPDGEEKTFTASAIDYFTGWHPDPEED